MMPSDGSLGMPGGAGAGAAPAHADTVAARRWAERLKAAGARLCETFTPLETVFLATGDRLRGLHREVAALSSKADAAGALLSSREFESMLDGLGVAARSTDHLRRNSDQSAALARMVGDSDTMLKGLAALSRVMFHVQVLAINAKVEASQMTAAGVDFSVFTLEIARLARSGIDTIEQVRTEVTALRDTAGRAHALQSNFEHNALPQLDAVAGRLSRSIEAMRAQQARASRGVHEIPPRLGTLFSHIADLVSDLQIYDMTRQRLEHVERALVLAADMLERDDVSDFDDSQVRIFVNGISDLQANQLRHAGEGYHAATADVARALGAMAEGVSALGTLCERTFGSDGGLSLLEIDRDIETAGAVFADFAHVRQQADSALHQVVTAAGRATGLVQSLNSVSGDMRLMGLNASIKCGNMGSMGRALNVIAQELQAYATLTRDHVSAVATSLDRVVTQTRDIGRAEEAAAGGAIGTLEATLAAASSNLKLTGQQVADLLGEIGHLGTNVVEQTRVAASGFVGKAEFDRPVEAGVRALTTLTRDSDPGLTGTALEEARREVLAFTEAHYTMASERAVHGSAVTGGGSILDVLKGGTEAEGGETNIDDLLF